jgi:hypothetical protein
MCCRRQNRSSARSCRAADSRAGSSSRTSGADLTFAPFCRDCLLRTSNPKLH